jgi:UPF0755 protein
MRAPTRTLRLALLAGGILVAGFVAWFVWSAYPLGGSGRAEVVRVRSGESVSQLAAALQRRGVISSSLAFRLDAMVFGAPTLHAGAYQIDQHSSFSRVRAVFGSSPNVAQISVAAGLSLNEVAVRLANALSYVDAPQPNAYAVAFVHAATGAARTDPFHPDGSLEGLIGTGTYDVTVGETPRELVDAMTARFVHEASRAGLVAGRSLHGLSAYQLVIAASIVEKEGYYHRNMGRVARVILNRLARGEALQMDSTILYHFHEDGGTVTPAMLRVDTPYNTYLHAGLTPTPICTPSAFALRAVVAPPAGQWLYFTLISRDGTMAFSDTFAQQLREEQLARSRGLG